MQARSVGSRDRLLTWSRRLAAQLHHRVLRLQRCAFAVCRQHAASVVEVQMRQHDLVDVLGWWHLAGAGRLSGRSRCRLRWPPAACRGATCFSCQSPRRICDDREEWRCDLRSGDPQLVGPCWASSQPPRLGSRARCHRQQRPRVGEWPVSAEVLTSKDSVTCEARSGSRRWCDSPVGGSGGRWRRFTTPKRSGGTWLGGG